eukprot:Hpha_TRINITY_DN15946_c1_g2::TRINITY_DN15946_c1_g2_i1::g.73102::m.73102/K10408/DNAH; dynein heavy chain, axonemal
MGGPNPLKSGYPSHIGSRSFETYSLESGGFSTGADSGFFFPLPSDSQSTLASLWSGRRLAALVCRIRRAMRCSFSRNFSVVSPTNASSRASGHVLSSVNGTRAFNSPNSASSSLPFERNKLTIPPEAPTLYGLHPNAEIEHRMAEADLLFSTIKELAPSAAGLGTDGGQTPQERTAEIAQDILSNILSDVRHSLSDLGERLEDDRTPHQHVFYQECERMNLLQDVVRESLVELDLALRGELVMSESIQSLADSILLDRIPESWRPHSFVTLRGLGSWCLNLCARNAQLLEWCQDVTTPKVTRVDLFFNPMSFLTAIAQHTAMQNSYDLDRMDLVCEPTKRMPDAVEHSAREGCHVFGLSMEGARWDPTGSSIEDSRLKELHSLLPVVTIRALPSNKVDRKDQYECPLYKTQARGFSFVTSVWLRSKQPVHKWIIAGAACVLDVTD